MDPSGVLLFPAFSRVLRFRAWTPIAAETRRETERWHAYVRKFYFEVMYTGVLRMTTTE